ncbi:MAG TPA: aquaporin [Candidatus Nanoarchaeia archaeon]|nr:aquaporin [Candidatus Nanoarchaeia archaeon]
MKAYIMELIGTMFLVLAVGLTGNPIAIGVMLMTMVYLGGHISGGHYNPAVTLAVWIRGKLPSKEVVPYWISQIMGGLIAGIIILFVGKSLIPMPSVGIMHAGLIEILLTFVIASTVLTTATSKAFKDSKVYGLAIGAALLTAAFIGGDISGGVFNPAVAIGPLVLAGAYANMALYIIAPLVGGALAAYLFKYFNPKG